jgi:hypothetical protein
MAKSRSQPFEAPIDREAKSRANYRPAFLGGVVPENHIRADVRGTAESAHDLAILLANKLPRIAWSVLASGRAFEANRLEAA